MQRRYLTPVRVGALGLLVMSALLLGSGPATARGAVGPKPHAGHVVVVGVPDLRWQDVTPDGTPALWRLADEGSVGTLSVRAFGFATTCAGGWLTLSAGSRATAKDADELRPCGDDLRVLTTAAARREIAEVNRRTGFKARPGTLGSALHAAGLRTAAAGDAGAVLAVADGAGRVDVVDGGDGLGGATPPVAGLDVAVVADSRLYDVAPESRAAVLHSIDGELARIAAALAPTDDLLVVGVSERLHGQPHLHVAVGWGQSFDHGLLRSASTGRTSFVQLIDVAPTIVAEVAGTPPTAMVGRPWFDGARRTTSLARTVRHFVDLDDAAHASSVTGRSFHDLYAGLVAVVFALSALVLRWRKARRVWVTWPALAFVALALSLLPVASFAVQAFRWWARGGTVFYAVIAAICVLGGSAAWLVARRRGAWAAVALTAGANGAFLMGDMLTGGRLQISAVLGDSPLIAGRFHGAGNVDFALISTTGLLSAACVAYVLRCRSHQRLAVVAAAGIVLVVLLIDGAPQFGDDFGGSLALAPAALVLVALVGRWVISASRVLLAAAVCFVPAGAFALYDYSRPDRQQTHIGRFVGQVLHGGAVTVVHRKALSNFHQLLDPMLFVPLIAALMAIVAILVARGDEPAPLAAALTGRRELGAGFVAVLICGVLGGALNDSGAGIPVAAATVALSLAIWLCAADAAGWPGESQSTSAS
jgi:hypothetical protein